MNRPVRHSAIAAHHPFERFIFVLLAIGSLFIIDANAHGVGTSYVSLESAANLPLQVSVDLHLRDLEFAIGLDHNQDTHITWGEVQSSRLLLMHYLQDKLMIKRGDTACVLGEPTLAIENYIDGPYAASVMQITCPTAGELHLQSNLLFDLDDSHRSLLRINVPNSQVVTVLTSSTRTWLQPTLGTEIDDKLNAFTRFVKQGVWHIWNGFDHLAFLGLLLLPSLRTQWASKAALVGNIFKVITAFTIAHSITLACAAFDLFHFSSRWVEALIAASIVVAGIANLFPRAARFGVGVAFGFGLIHGLGFASALTEMTLDVSNRMLPLMGFNLGVELGQLVVVAGLMPLLILGKKNQLIKERVVQSASISIGLLGMVWLIQRTLFF